MSTMIGTDNSDDGIEAVTKMGGIRPWIGLFLGISGGAVAIAVILGLLVVLTNSAVQAQALTAPGVAILASAGH